MNIYPKPVSRPSPVGLPWPGNLAEAAIPDGSITTEKLANEAVTTPKIKPFNVTIDSLARESVSRSKVLAGTLTGDRMQPETIDNLRIKTGAVDDTKIGPRTVSPVYLSSEQYTLGEILDMIAYMVRSITGEGDWRSEPLQSIRDLNEGAAIDLHSVQLQLDAIKLSLGAIAAGKTITEGIGTLFCEV